MGSEGEEGHKVQVFLQENHYTVDIKDSRNLTVPWISITFRPGRIEIDQYRRRQGWRRQSIVCLNYSQAHTYLHEVKTKNSDDNNLHLYCGKMRRSWHGRAMSMTRRLQWEERAAPGGDIMHHAINFCTRLTSSNRSHSKAMLLTPS